MKKRKRNKFQQNEELNGAVEEHNKRVANSYDNWVNETHMYASGEAGKGKKGKGKKPQSSSAGGGWSSSGGGWSGSGGSWKGWNDSDWSPAKKNQGGEGDGSNPSKYVTVKFFFL